MLGYSQGLQANPLNSVNFKSDTPTQTPLTFLLNPLDHLVKELKVIDLMGHNQVRLSLRKLYILPRNTSLNVALEKRKIVVSEVLN